ncbi:MAG: LysR family transcriptional regulator [Burkholderiales bacterium]|nr:LysR family transcriptional regulator [Burkholderiales bacterium]
MMLSELLCSFFEVARQGSVALAARQIKLSQPTITSRIRQLEEIYQIELFYRGGARWVHQRCRNSPDAYGRALVAGRSQY